MPESGRKHGLRSDSLGVLLFFAGFVAWASHAVAQEPPPVVDDLAKPIRSDAFPA